MCERAEVEKQKKENRKIYAQGEKLRQNAKENMSKSEIIMLGNEGSLVFEPIFRSFCNNYYPSFFY
jgi:hypothetical protein